MSEKKGPFDAAIEVLEDIALTTNLCRHIPGYKNRTKLIRAAIPVLKAAGKVEKKEALASLDDIYLSASVSPWDRSVKHLGIVRSLLESLPEKEKE